MLVLLLEEMKEKDRVDDACNAHVEEGIVAGVVSY
jgi:hypothetical protein